jgi:KTSC domain
MAVLPKNSGVRANRNAEDSPVAEHIRLPRSRRIAFVSYDSKELLLEVAYAKGITFEFRDVPADLYDALVMDAEPDDFVNDRIRYAGYPYMQRERPITSDDE